MVGRFESGKDTVQVLAESAATHLGKIAMIITDAMRDIAKETGEWVTDVIEMREATDRAKVDAERSRERTAGHPTGDVPPAPADPVTPADDPS